MTKPEDLKVNNSMVQIIFATNTQKKDAVLIIGSYEFKKDVYGILDYAELKGYFNRIVDKFNEKLIFVKDKDTKIWFCLWRITKPNNVFYNMLGF